MDNMALLFGACGLAFFTLWLTVLSTAPSPPRGIGSRRRNPLSVYGEILNIMDPEPVGFWWAFGSLLWGLFVGTDWGITTALPYRFPDNVAGAVIGTLGLLGLVAIGFNLHRTYSFAILGLALAWGFIGWSAGVTSSWHASAWLVYTGASVVAGWVWVRLQWDDTRLTTPSLDG